MLFRSGSIERYKTRLVVKDFTQKYGIDYEETFALFAHSSSVRALLDGTFSNGYQKCIP